MTDKHPAPTFEIWDILEFIKMQFGIETNRQKYYRIWWEQFQLGDTIEFRDKSTGEICKSFFPRDYFLYREFNGFTRLVLTEKTLSINKTK